MGQNEENLKFKKLVNNDFNNIPQIQRDKIKEKIMDKYNVSSEDAEKILFQIEKKEAEKNKKKINKESFQHDDSSSNEQNFKKIIHSDAISSNVLNEKVRDIKSKIPMVNQVHSINNQTVNTQKENKSINGKALKNKLSNNNPDIKFSENAFFINQKSIDEKQNAQIVNEDINVDSILGDILPDYNQQISIKLDHVDLTFEVSNEKIDTLKEAFIRTIKGNKSNKIKIHALNDVSFQIYKGEKVGIIGYNGAGKSTLLNVITGIYPPDKGYVTTYGKISPLLSLGAGFDHNFSGRRNIIINGAVLGYDKKFLESKIDEIIEFSELGEFIDIPVKNYSSGMFAKLGFSIATMVNPDILIIDEILGVGDVNFVKKSRDKIRSLMDGETTVLLVSHSIPQIRELCDKAIWIDNGSVRAIGEVNKICDEYLKDAEKASNEQLANIQLVNK